jgi:hypothetical protein
MPGCVKRTVDEGVRAAGIAVGFIFRAVSRSDAIWGDHLTPKSLLARGEGRGRRASLHISPFMTFVIAARRCATSPRLEFRSS